MNNIDTFKTLATAYTKGTSRAGARVEDREEKSLRNAFADLTPLEQNAASKFVKDSGNPELGRVLKQIVLMGSDTGSIYR